MADHLDQIARAKEAIARLRMLAAKQPGHYLPALTIALVDLGLGQFERGHHTDAEAAIDEALSIGRRILSEHLGDPADRPRTLSAVAAALQIRYELSGDVSSLNEAIIALRQALAEASEDDRNRISLLSNLGNALRMRFERIGVAADLAETVKLQRQAIAEAPEDDQDRTALLSNLGTALRLSFEVAGDLDDLDEAVAVLRQAVSMTPRGNPHLARRLSNLGAALRARFERAGEQTDLSEAESLLRSAVEAASPEEYDYSALQSNLADVLQDLADILNDDQKRAEAEAQFTAALQSRVRVLGPDHPDTLASRNNLASVLAQHGQLAEAEAEFRALAEIQQRVLGPDHPDTLASRNNLASVLAQHGQPAEAEAEFRAVLAGRQAILGPEHSDTLSTRALLIGTLDALAKARTPPNVHHQGMPPVHRTVLAVDIAAFAASYRSDVDQLSLREGLYNVLKQVLIETGVPWDTCAIEDRGDGVLILVPAEVPKHFLIELPDRLQVALHNYNTRRATGAELKLRLSLGAGEIHTDSRGVSGPGIIQAFRMLDAPSVKQALENSPSNIVVIVSAWFFDNVIRQAADANAVAEYHPVQILVKESSMTGWMRIPPVSNRYALEESSDQPSTAASPANPAMLLELVDALLAVPSMADESGRRLLTRFLPGNVAAGIPYHSRARTHMSAIVATCLEHDGGLDALLNAVRTIEPTSMPVKNLEAVTVRARPSYANLPTSDAPGMFDIAVSFAGEQREYVEQVVRAAKALGLRVFYDRDLGDANWGRNFLVELRTIYGATSTLFVVPFISASYLARPFSMDEFLVAQMNSAGRSDSDLLPVLMGEVDMPNELSSLGFVRAENYTPEQLAELLKAKVDEAKRTGRPQQRLGGSRQGFPPG